MTDDAPAPDATGPADTTPSTSDDGDPADADPSTDPPNATPSTPADTTLSAAEIDRYLARIGLSPAAIRDAPRDRDTLERLQRAHLTSVPFETFSITGDPFGEWDGPGVTLSTDALFEKIVVDERGGYCFELNGLFTDLLRGLGYDADRAAAMVLSDDGDPSPPANHHTVVVDLDRRYVADVGTGNPKTRTPVPLDGETVRDDLGTAWRVVESDRPDSAFLLQYRRADAAEWADRYVFDDVDRELSYFAATCEYLSTAPESPFVDDPTISVGTDDGSLELTTDSFTRIEDGEETTTTVGKERWSELVAAEFGLSYPFC
ncbi:MAG: arylamine N-acetyltransferase [Halobaculum sp.]